MSRLGQWLWGAFCVPMSFIESVVLPIIGTALRLIGACVSALPLLVLSTCMEGWEGFAETAPRLCNWIAFGQYELHVSVD